MGQHFELDELEKELNSTETFWGLQNSAHRANKFLHGIHQRYYLIGAGSGVGKTTYVDQYYVIEPIEYCIANNIDITVYYYSFEIAVKEKMYKWVSYFVWDMFKIMLPADYIAQRIKGVPIHEDHKPLIQSAIDRIREIRKHIVFVGTAVHPTKILEDLATYHYPKYGTVLRGQDIKERGGKTRKGFIKGFNTETGRKPWTFVVIDHLAQGAPEQGLSTKGTMDRFSSHAVTLRNIFGTTSVFVQQFNNELQDAKREATSRKGVVSITPDSKDFGDSTYTYRDADVVIALVRPSNYELQTWGGFDLSERGLDNNMVAGFLLKNRYGPEKRILPYFHIGPVGKFVDLPIKPLLAPIEMESFYSQALKIEETCQLFSQNPESQ